MRELLAEHDSERLLEISYGLLPPLSPGLFIELPRWPLLSSSTQTLGAPRHDGGIYAAGAARRAPR